MQPLKELFSLKDRVAVVTGGAGLLGKIFCNGLAELGASVVVVDIDKEDSNQVAKGLENKFGRKIIGIGCDVSDTVSVAGMVNQVISEFGRIDILHNNAAWKSDNLDEFYAPMETYSIEQWREISSVNIDGMFLVAQAVGNQMVAQGSGGSIVQTSSIYGILGPDNSIYTGSHYQGRPINTPAVYAATKAAVLGLTKYLSTYWAQENIRVNSITPGGVDNDHNDEFKRRYGERTPLGRMARAEEMVGALLYLASDASSYVTGENIVIDGGLSTW